VERREELYLQAVGPCGAAGSLSRHHTPLSAAVPAAQHCILPWPLPFKLQALLAGDVVQCTSKLHAAAATAFRPCTMMQNAGLLRSYTPPA
jgi:hypothetical protein